MLLAFRILRSNINYPKLVAFPSQDSIYIVAFAACEKALLFGLSRDSWRKITAAAPAKPKQNNLLAPFNCYLANDDRWKKLAGKSMK